MKTTFTRFVPVPSMPVGGLVSTPVIVETHSPFTDQWLPKATEHPCTISTPIDAEIKLVVPANDSKFAV